MSNNEKIAVDKDKPLGWMRRWAFDGETPKKERNANGRMAWPFKYKLLPVSEHKCLEDDIALYAQPPRSGEVALSTQEFDDIVQDARRNRMSPDEIVLATIRALERK